jgi:hypothetical protein
MPSFTVHFDEVGGQHRAVPTKAATAEHTIAELRRDMMLCLPKGTAPAEFDAHFRNFIFDGPATCESAWREEAR